MINHGDKSFIRIFLVIVVLVLSGCSTKPDRKIENPNLQCNTVTNQNTVLFHYDTISGIGYEKGCTRSDPSDVIRVGETWYVWYTKVTGRYSGYWGTIWYATSEDEGFSWTEGGEVLGIGEVGNFDSQATFTPNILYADGKYYLYYTGVKPTPGRSDGVFENNSTNDFTAIGAAVSDSPDGPFVRISKNPVIEVSEDTAAFDSYRVDDASLIFRNEKYWLYFKGRNFSHGIHGPRQTQMGVAFSEDPAGPFKKYGKSILPESHEVFIWPCGDGVLALASISSTLEFAQDGIDFSSNKLDKKIDERPNAPGGFRPDLTDPEDIQYLMNWGISMVHNRDECYLIRFEIR